MNLRTFSIACLITFWLATTALTQSNSLETTVVPASSEISTITGDNPGTVDELPSIKEQLRSELAQLVVEAIHNFFRDFRTSLGLPEVLLGPIGDLLTFLESMIIDMVENVLKE
jgi:hypothetical protein